MNQMKFVWLTICGVILAAAGLYFAFQRKSSDQLLKQALVNPKIVIIKSKHQLMLYSANKSRVFELVLGILL